MSYSAEVLADSPLIYLRLGDSSGTTAVDSSGNGRNGTYAGGTLPTLGTTGLLTGDSDTAITMTGAASQKVTVADDNSLDGLSAFTIEMWFQGSAALSGTNYLANRDDGSGNRSFLFRISSSKLQFVKVPNGTVTATAATTLATGTVYHFAAVYNGTDIRLYVNGTLDNTPAAATGTLGTITQVLEVACRLTGNSNPGVYDEVAVYGTALSATRIAAHYTAGTTAGGSAASGSGALSLSGSGATKAAATASGALSLTGSGAAAVVAAGSAALSLSGSGTASAPGLGAGTGSLALSGSADVGIGVTGSGSLSLSGAADTSADVTAAGSLSLSGAGTAEAPIAATASGSLSLSASGTAHRPRTTYAEYVLDDAPIAYYRLGDAVDTGSPTTAHDSSVAAHDGTYGAGGASSSPGALLSAYDDGFLAMDAVTNTLTVPYFAELNFTAFSAEAWIEVTAVASYNALFGRAGGSFAPFEVGNNASGQIVVKIHNGTTSATYASVTPAWSAWHHVVVTRDGSGTLSIYIDKVLDAQYTGTLTPNTATHGGLVAGTAGQGRLDELALYDYALTAAQIADHYVAGRGEVSGGSLSLTGSATVTTVSAGGTAVLELFGGAVAAAVHETDTSNLLNGRRRRAVAHVTVAYPDVTPPSSLAVKVDKAVAYPTPTLVGGRPT